MVDNQHEKIIGYRDLSIEEIALINQIKLKGQGLKHLVLQLRRTKGISQSWVSIGIRDLQTGLMALTCAVAKPDSF